MRRAQGGVLLAGVFASLVFALCRAPAVHALSALLASAVAAAAAGAAEPRALDEEVGGRTAASLRTAEDHSKVIYAMAACALLGAASEAGALSFSIAVCAHGPGWGFGAPTPRPRNLLGFWV